VAVSPNGKSVYVASQFGDAVVRLNRNPSTGAIAQPAGNAGCISETGAGPCADGHALNGASGVAISPDGANVYVSSAFSEAVVRIDRNTTSGAIAQPAGTSGCISATGTNGTCADGHALDGTGGVAASPEGKNVYVAAVLSNAVVRLDRAP
jgi:DNA-binding beta-propeller fold protein YncE